MAKKLTQGELLAWHLNHVEHTYADMHRLCISTSPHKRVMEWLDRNPAWELRKGKNNQNLVTWRIVRNRKQVSR
jgi:hypothetical protein